MTSKPNAKQQDVDWAAMLAQRAFACGLNDGKSPAPDSPPEPSTVSMLVGAYMLDVAADELPWQDSGPLGQEDW